LNSRQEKRSLAEPCLRMMIAVSGTSAHHAKMYNILSICIMKLYINMKGNQFCLWIHHIQT
jgi:hypothetical protein